MAAIASSSARTLGGWISSGYQRRTGISSLAPLLDRSGLLCNGGQGIGKFRRIEGALGNDLGGTFGVVVQRGYKLVKMRDCTEPKVARRIGEVPFVAIWA